MKGEKRKEKGEVEGRKQEKDPDREILWGKIQPTSKFLTSVRA